MRIDEIRAREQEATPGPWTRPGVMPTHEGKTHADFLFIANARQDIPYLLSEVDRLTAELKSVKAKLSIEKGIVNKRNKQLEDFHSITAELEQYRKQKADGLLVRFPCKVGENCFVLINSQNTILEITVSAYQFSIWHSEWTVSAANNGAFFLSNAYTTREEAEQAKSES